MTGPRVQPERAAIVTAKPRWYIRNANTGAYWMQGARDWTDSPFSATLFDTEELAFEELAWTHGEAEVRKQDLPAYKTIQREVLIKGLPRSAKR